LKSAAFEDAQIEIDQLRILERVVIVLFERAVSGPVVGLRNQSGQDGTARSEEATPGLCIAEGKGLNLPAPSRTHLWLSVPAFAPDRASEPIDSLAIPISLGHNQKASVASLRPR